LKLIGFVITLLIIGYFVIDYSASNFSLTVGGANVPVYQTKDLHSLYTDECSQNNYNTFKNGTGDYKTSNKSKLFNLKISTQISYFEVGYTDSPIACSSSGLVNSVVLKKQSLHTNNNQAIENFDTVLTIPANKYIYIYATGHQTSVSANILDSDSIVD